MDSGMKLEMALRNIGRAGEKIAYEAFRGYATGLGNMAGDKAEVLADFINEQLKSVGYKVQLENAEIEDGSAH